MSQQVPMRPVPGILAGLAVFLGSMAILAFLAVRLGIVPSDPGAEIDLTNWLLVEVLGGCLAGLFAGLVSRHVGRGARASVWLALIVLAVGLLEAGVLQSQRDVGRAAAPLFLVWIAPAIGPLGILIGGLFLRWSDPQRRR